MKGEEKGMEGNGRGPDVAVKLAASSDEERLLEDREGRRMLGARRLKRPSEAVLLNRVPDDEVDDLAECARDGSGLLEKLSVVRGIDRLRQGEGEVQEGHGIARGKRRRPLTIPGCGRGATTGRANRGQEKGLTCASRKILGRVCC